VPTVDLDLHLFEHAAKPRADFQSIDELFLQFAFGLGLFQRRLLHCQFGFLRLFFGLDSLLVDVDELREIVHARFRQLQFALGN
jgi:hypothetical protein